MAQRSTIYQCLAIETIFNQFIVGFGLFMGFFDTKKNVDYHQIYPVCEYDTGVQKPFTLFFFRVAP